MTSRSISYSYCPSFLAARSAIAPTLSIAAKTSRRLVFSCGIDSYWEANNNLCDQCGNVQQRCLIFRDSRRVSQPINRLVNIIQAKDHGEKFHAGDDLLAISGPT